MALSTLESHAHPGLRSITQVLFLPPKSDLARHPVKSSKGRSNKER